MPITRQKMTQRLFDQIVDEVHAELMKAPQEERDQFVLAEYGKNRLIDYHHRLGRYIRNTYSLWTFDWEPELIDGVDHSPFHPDNISMEIIKKVWERGLGRTTPDEEGL
jgi:hypothetical protein